MNIFPAFFGLQGKAITIFGSGEEAHRKLRLAAKTPAELRVVTDDPEAITVEFRDKVSVCNSEQAHAALDGAALAIIAVSDDRCALACASLARKLGVPVNVVDRPELCDFTVPSILDRGDVVAAIATGGAAPILAKDIREKLEMLLPQRIGGLAEFAKRHRRTVKEAEPDSQQRRLLWEEILRGTIGEAVLRGDDTRAESFLAARLAGTSRPAGMVHIVGAGPGDPELLTIKALRLIQDADIVFHDRLVGAEIIDLIRRDAERVSVGKTKGYHSVPQTEIHERLIAAARAGKRVVRLKGGDPFVFGRGGEELDALRDADIDVQVVPGISSALGCAASAGLPLTHRDHAQSVTFVTGHAQSGGVPSLDWKALAIANHTLVVFMGVGTSATISERLIKAGRAASTPVAVIENGTRDNEIRAFGELSALPQLIESHGIEGPALLIIGEVAALPAEAHALAARALEIAA